MGGAHVSDRLAEALLRYTDSQAGDSPFATPIAGLGVLRSDRPGLPSHRIARPSMCIVAQGAKWSSFGGNRLDYRAGQALVIGVEAPSIGQVVQASPDKPCLVLIFELDLEIMRSVADALARPPRPRGESPQGVFVTDFEGPLADCALRLANLLSMPEAITALYPGIMREVC